MSLYTTDAFYTEELLRAHPDKAFLFGDNLIGKGKGGQAVIRDEKNALGIPTKRLPSNAPDAFFYDIDLHRFIVKVLDKLALVAGVAERSAVVVPVDANGQISLGLGLAALNVNSPTTYKLICEYLNSLADTHGGWKKLETQPV